MMVTIMTGVLLSSVGSQLLTGANRSSLHLQCSGNEVSMIMHVILMFSTLDDRNECPFI